MKKIIFLAIAVFLFLPPASSQAVGAQSVGKVTYTEGIADLMREGEGINLLNEDDHISIGDRIRTKKYSRAEVTFDDKSIVKLAPDTCIFIDGYLLDGNKRRLADIRLTRGKIEAVVSRTGRPETFIINTPNATGKVRGSDIFVFYQAGKTGALIKKGLMSLSNNSLPAGAVDMRRGDYSIVSFDEAPGEPRPYFEAEMMRHEKDVNPAVVKKWVPAETAAEMSGTATAISGDVRIFKKGADDWRDVRADETISEGDKLQTAEGATVEICFSNGNSVFLKENTELTVATLKYDPDTGEYDNTFESAKGRIKAVIGTLGRKSTFQVKTPNAICGVVGTVMYLDIRQNETQAFYEGGGGIVSSPISGHSETMNAGTNTLINAQGRITPPMPTMGEQRMQLEESWGSQDFIGGYSAPLGPLVPKGGAIFGPGAGPLDGQPMTDKDSPKIDIIDNPFMPPPFDETFPPPPLPPPPDTLYDAPMAVDLAYSSGWIASPGNAHIYLKQDGTWEASLTGNFDSPPMPSWSIVYDNLNNDQMSVSDANPWTTGTWSGDVNGVINGTPINKNITGTAQGTYSGTGSGTFDGTASGTWQDNGVIVQ